MKIIVDTNIFFSALLKENNEFRNELIFNNKHDFYTCHFFIVELFKYKEKIIEISQINEDNLLEIFYEILKNINLFNESLISEDNYKKAYNLCKTIDEKDIPFVALALELDGYLWTGDKKLKKALIDKNFNKFHKHTTR